MLRKMSGAFASPESLLARSLLCCGPKENPLNSPDRMKAGVHQLFEMNWISGI